MSIHILNSRIATGLTNDKIALRDVLEKGSVSTFLREMIGFAAERRMALETESLCGARPAPPLSRPRTRPCSSAIMASLFGSGW